MESQDLLKEYGYKLNQMDIQINDLKESRKEILKDAKSDGFSTSILNKAITQLRQEKKKPQEVSECDLYKNLLQDIIEVLE